MIQPGDGEGDLLNGTTALVERAKEYRKAMAEFRQSLDSLRAGAREIEARLWRPHEMRRRIEELSQATDRECELTRELIRFSTELVETTREILKAQRARRAERRQRPDGVPTPNAAS